MEERTYAKQMHSLIKMFQAKVADITKEMGATEAREMQNTEKTKMMESIRTDCQDGKHQA